MRLNVSGSKPPYDSRVYLARASDNEAVIVSEIYSVSENDDVVINAVEKWTLRQTVEAQSDFIWQRRCDLSGLTFNVGIFHYPPYSIINDYDNLSASTGFNMDLLHHLKKEMNFRVERFNVPESGNFGREVSNGSWDGVVGMCQRREIDFSSTLIKATLPRSFVIKYSQVVTSHSNVFVTRRGETASALSIFTTLRGAIYSLGLATLIALVFVAVVVFAKLEWRKADLFEFALLTFGYCTSQGSTDEPLQGAWSMRIVALSCLVFSVLAANSFSARLASLLSVKVQPNAIESINDIERFGLNLFVLGGTATLDTFAFAPSHSVERRLWLDRISTHSRFTPYTYDEVIANFLAEANDSAMLVNPQRIKLWINENRQLGCKMNILPRSLKIRFAYPARKDFPYLEAFNYHIGKMKETGLLEKLKSKWIYPVELSQEYMCLDPYSDEPEGVDFTSVDILFYFLISGCASSLIVLLMEKFCRR